MKAEIKPRKFNPIHIQQASAVDLADYSQNRLSVFGITIDEATTVDRDDGIWLVELSNGNFELQVSITDVSTLIPQESPLDQEAEKRVVTLYHTSPPTPMLPTHISGNLGSLEEEKRRLALTIFFEINSNGDVNKFLIKETIFTNKKAFSYEEVESILAKPQNIPEHKLLIKMQQLAQLFAKKRVGKSGVLTPNGYVDEDGNLIQDNVNAHQLIAEFMILTNITIANFLAENNLPAIYRTQDVGTTDFEFVSKTMGHCLVPAIYEYKCKPHVGLGVMGYTHFSSPLRRFVDLVNHRVVKSFIQKKSHPYTVEQLEKLCNNINDFQAKFKLDRTNYLKQKRKEELDSKFGDLDSLNIEKISGDDLSDLIQYCINKNTLEKIIPSLEKRKEELQPKDFYNIWFVGKSNYFLEDENIDSISVLRIRSQIENSIIDYESEYCHLRQKNYVFCYLDGKTTLNPQEDAKKNKAKQKAALATIKSYLRGELTDNPNGFPEVNLNEIIKEKLANYAENNFDLSSLDEKEFSQIIDYAIKTQFENNIIEEIERRILNLSVKDLYKIWFEGKINKFFEYEDLDSTSVVLTYCQLNNYTVEYKIDYCPDNDGYTGICSVNHQTHPDIVTHQKKNKAKQKASMAFIKSYINQTLIPYESNIIEEINNNDLLEEIGDIDPIISEENDQENVVIDCDSEEKLTIDWVSTLHYICQVNNQEFPEYIFNNIDGFFDCIISLSSEKNKILKSTGYGKSKKEAKQCASKVFLIQHYPDWENELGVES